MKEKLCKKLFLLMSILLFVSIGLFPVYGQAKAKAQASYFTRDIIVEIIRTDNNSVTTRKELDELSKILSHFFTTYQYRRLYGTMYKLIQRKDVYQLKPKIYRALAMLDFFKRRLFSKIQIDYNRYYKFSTNTTDSFGTIAIDTSQIHLQAIDVDLMLMVLSAGLTEAGPFRLRSRKFMLKRVSLNWLMAGQFMSGMITGAPGGLPVQPPTSPVMEADYSMDIAGISTFHSIRFPLPVHQKEIKKPRQGKKNDIDVFILDTVPYIRDIYKGYNKYKNNNIIKKIFSSIGTHHSIQYYNGIDPDFHTHQNEDSGNKNVSDHGLFIAGTIHLQADNANLHLIETLNKYGIGTLEAILWGFKEAVEEADSRKPFIVNTSFTTKMQFPDDKSTYNKNITDPRIQMVHGLLTPEIHLALLKSAVELIRRHNGVVIASAGNDSDSEEHVDAGYPARFYSVIGVGSTRKDGIISSFSNKPGPGGIMAFGGEVDNVNNNTIEGILSIYLTSPYMDSTVDNTSGWAMWAGSSFATGMVSGSVALLLARGYSRTGTINILRNSCSTIDGYDVLRVNQGL